MPSRTSTQLLAHRYSPAFFGGRQMAILLGRLSPASRTLRKPPGSHLPTSRRFASLHYPPPRLSWIAMPPYFATGLQDSFPMVTFSPYRFPHPPESLLMPGASSFTSPTSTRHFDHLPSTLGSIFSHGCYAHFSNRVSKPLFVGSRPSSSSLLSYDVTMISYSFSWLILPRVAS